MLVFVKYAVGLIEHVVQGMPKDAIGSLMSGVVLLAVEEAVGDHVSLGSGRRSIISCPPSL